MRLRTCPITMTVIVTSSIVSMLAVRLIVRLWCDIDRLLRGLRTISILVAISVKLVSRTVSSCLLRNRNVSRTMNGSQ